MGTTAADLHRFIAERRDEIVRQWSREAGELHHLSGAALRDHIPELLDCMARDPAWDDPQLRQVMSSHLLQRIEKNVALAQIIEELALLRRTIADLWRREAGPEADVAMEPLHRMIDRLLVLWSERYEVVRTRVLEAIEDALSRGGDLDSILRRVLRVLFDASDAVDTAAILLREGDHLRVRATVGLEEEVARRVRIPLGDGFAGRVAAEARPVVLEHVDRDAVFSEVLRDAGLRALYGIPLVRPGPGEREVIGVAHVGSRTFPAFTEHTRRMFELIVEQVSAHLHQAMLLEELQTERARIRAFLDHAPVVLFLEDLDGRYVTVSRRIAEAVAVSPRDLIGRTSHEVFPQEVADMLVANDRQVLEREEPMWVEEVLPRGGERRTFMTVRFPVYDGQGRLAGVGGVATDITERKRAERGQELLARAGDALGGALDPSRRLAAVAGLFVPELADICVVDLVDDGEVHRAHVEHADPRDAEIARRLRELSLGGHPLATRTELDAPHVVTSWDDEVLNRLVSSDEERRLLEQLEPRCGLVLPLPDRRGRVILVASHSGHRYDEQELALAEELARRVGLALENARLHEQARRAVRSREELLGIVAHDLRNPLHIVGTALGMLQRRVPDPRVSHWVEPSLQATRRMRRLLDDLLDAGMIEAGQLRISPEPVSPDELVAAAVADNAAVAEAVGIQLEPDITPGLPPVLADQDRLLQVFGNLVGNALKFSPPGTRVTVCARPAAGAVRFYVADEGPGIPPEDQQRIFDRYSRARAERRAGAGLGLSISKGIVEAHGGTIEVESEEGGGTTFAFTIPAAPSP